MQKTFANCVNTISLRHSKMSHKEILDDIRQGAESFMLEFTSCVAEKQAIYDTSEKK